MKQLEVNLGDSRSDTNMTMTLGTGVNWGQAYQAVSKPRLISAGLIFVATFMGFTQQVWIQALITEL